MEPLSQFKTKIMSNEQAVETKVEIAATQPEVATQTTEVDYEAELTKKDAELAKVRAEKENYRRGMLKAKGKLPDEDDISSNDEDIDAKIDRKVEEKYLATREAQVLAEKDALVIASAKKIKELSLALKNRSQVSSSTGQGSNQDRPEVRTDSTLSEDQLSSLRAKGWDDKKIELFKKNLKVGIQVPK